MREEEEQDMKHQEHINEGSEELPMPILHKVSDAQMHEESDGTVIIGGGVMVNGEADEDIGIKCRSCAKVPEDMSIVFLEKCEHIVCKECLVEITKLSYPDVKCPCDDCEQKVNDYEIREAMGQAAYDEL